MNCMSVRGYSKYATITEKNGPSKVCQRKVHHPNGGVPETCQVYERKPEAHASDKFFMVKMFISFLKTLLHFKSYVIWSNI